MVENNVKEKSEDVKNVDVKSVDEKGITLNDLILLKQIVNLASRRGAFSAEEFKDIGDVYNRLDNFINIQMKLLEDNKDSSASASGDDETKELTI
tara:strand:- start:475 stop:759 length:285 start_codon:yes stop_codon:yes gene_type:complete